jgi:hypothetical protein
MNKLQAKRYLRLTAAALPVLLALAACGGHHHDDPAPAPTPTPTPPPVSMTDAFITYVTQQVAALSETAEPVSTDGVTATAPENSEPVPVPNT